MVKGIIDPSELQHHFEGLLAKYGRVYVETDMRALFNPMRMEVIGEAAQNLIDRLNSPCPKCAMPGYWVTATEAGLPCSACGMPTKSTLKLIYTCNHCGHSETKPNPDRDTEEPMYCDFCNP